MSPRVQTRTERRKTDQARFISNWCVIAICLVVALPTVLAITEPTPQEALGDFLREDEDRPGAKNKQEAAHRHDEVVSEKTMNEHRVVDA